MIRNCSARQVALVVLLGLTGCGADGLESSADEATTSDDDALGKSCGNGVCGGKETCSNCPTDCGACNAASCGDGACGNGETCSGCPADCGVCSGSCGDGACGSGETCSSCPADCGACSGSCGDGACGSGETCSTCPSDCGACPLYVADFETGDFSQVISQQEKSPDRITLTTSGPLQSTYSALVKNGPTDTEVAGSGGSLRAEIAFRSISSGFFGGGSLDGKDTWITWEEKLDPNFEIASWCVLTQFLGGAGSGWPMFAIEANGPAPGKLSAVVRGGQVSVTEDARVVLADPVPLGSLLKFKVYHHWSTGTGGIVKVWLNGVLKANITGVPNLFIGHESEPYQKGGIYRGAAGVTRDSQLRIDNVRWWKSDPG